MSGVVIAERWLATRLAGITHNDVAVKVYRHPSPNTATFPNITIGIVSAVDLYQIGNTESYERLQYIVRVWDTGTSAARVHAVAKEIHRRINQVAPEFFDDGMVVSCFRVGAIAPDVVQEQDGTLYQADGGIYQLHITTYDN